MPARTGQQHLLWLPDALGARACGSYRARCSTLGVAPPHPRCAHRAHRNVHTHSIHLARGCASQRLPRRSGTRQSRRRSFCSRAGTEALRRVQRQCRARTSSLNASRRGRAGAGRSLRLLACSPLAHTRSGTVGWCAWSRRTGTSKGRHLGPPWCGWHALCWSVEHVLLVLLLPLAWAMRLMPRPVLVPVRVGVTVVLLPCATRG